MGRGLPFPLSPVQWVSTVAPCGQVRTAGGRGLGDSGRLPLDCQFRVAQTPVNHPSPPLVLWKEDPGVRYTPLFRLRVHDGSPAWGPRLQGHPGGTRVASVCTFPGFARRLTCLRTTSGPGRACCSHALCDSRGWLVARSCLALCDPWTVARQAPLSVEFSRQGHWNGLPFPSPRVCSNWYPLSP